MICETRVVTRRIARLAAILIVLMVLGALAGAQAKSPGSAASQNRDAFLSRLFVTNDGAAIAPNVYAVFVMQIKVSAQQNRDTD